MINQVENPAEVVEWHSWSGTVHKAGPPGRPNNWGQRNRRPLCGTTATLVEADQVHRPRLRQCRKCFPIDLAAIEAELREHGSAETKLAEVTRVLVEIESGEHATTGRQFGQGMAHAAKLIREAL